jgi:hypothetical protein
VSADRCSDLSRTAREPLAATATYAVRWLLLEVRTGWPREVTSADALPEPAAAAVSEWRSRTPDSRVLFVRRPGRVAGPSLAFVVEADEVTRRVRRFELAALDDLAHVDLDEGGQEVGTGLVLVCGHGGRDQCCALRGTPVFGALASGLDDEQLWISSHQGGHRFAANVLVLPDALQFGRVEPDEAAGLVGRALGGAIELDRYRGRACYEPVARAAEHALRVARGLTRVQDLVLVGADETTARFRDADGRVHEVVVAEADGPSVPSSCGEDPKPQRVLVGTVV